MVDTSAFEQSSTSVAIITGGGSGLGEATATKLAEQGLTPFIIDLPTSKGEQVARALGGEFYAADVTVGTAVEAACQAAASLGSVRALVTCAGVATPGRVLPREGFSSFEAFSQVVDVNLKGTFNALRCATHVMQENEPIDGDRGVVVMTASVAAFDGQIGQAAYSASKGGVAAMTLPVARELARPSIRVMSIAPGTFETPMLAGLKEEVQQSLAAQIPHPSRLGRPSEFADLVAHIIDNKMLNGEVIRLDGALRMPPR